MITTSTLSICTRVTARRIALPGYASAAANLIGSGFVDRLLLVFPCWVLVVSIYILSENLRKEPQAVAEHGCRASHSDTRRGELTRSR
jgi:hypothetical protein